MCSSRRSGTALPMLKFPTKSCYFDRLFAGNLLRM